VPLKYLLVEETTGKYHRGAAPGTGEFVDQDYDIGVGGQVNFVVTQTFTALSKIDVWVNGRKQRPGATYDFDRNVSLNRIEFTYTVQQYSWVEIRVHL
jgi:hypothetical protein